MSKDIKQPKTEKGKAGEVHQLAGHGFAGLTTAQGTAVSDNQNSLRAGARGPTLLEDFHFREKLFHFDHERIPERVVHARGVGAHGYFETLKAIPDLTKASLFQTVGERIPVFARISTVAGNKGSMDLARDVRGFAVKFYTKEGNWDLVGNNMPVFFIQDAIKFPDVIHAVKAAPDRDFPQAQSAHDNFWDYISLTPEAMHMVMWIMSDRAIPRSLRFIEGFGVHSFRFINAENKSSFVKFHWKPKLGMQSVVWNEALKINGADPDFHRRDLWHSIKAGQYPEWELGVQVFDDEWAANFEFDILDPTKLIPEEICPVEIIGRMVLDRMPDNFFAETEQVAFCTQNIVPGIDFSDDPLLQGRNFSYLDTQIKRLGSPNFTHLPINAPKCPFHHFQQDGHMAFHNPVGRANYEPNSWGAQEGGPREQKEAGHHSYAQEIGGKKLRERSPSFGDHYSQARQFYISQTQIEQKHIIDALSFELSKCAHLHIRRAMIAHLLNIDPDLAQNVADNIGLAPLPQPAETAIPARTDLAPSPALSILKNGPQDFKGRKIGILLSDGIDSNLLQTIEYIAKQHEVNAERIAMKIGGIVASDGQAISAQHQIDGAPSVLFDAVLLLAEETQIAKMIKNPSIRDFINDAYVHYKFIGHNAGAKLFFAKLGLAERIDGGFSEVNNAADFEKFIAICDGIRFWQRIDAA